MKKNFSDDGLTPGREHLRSIAAKSEHLRRSGGSLDADGHPLGTEERSGGRFTSPMGGDAGAHPRASLRGDHDLFRDPKLSGAANDTHIVGTTGGHERQRPAQTTWGKAAAPRKKGEALRLPSQFNLPVASSARAANASGATSFHFSHEAISKTDSVKSTARGTKNRKGAASDHADYIERAEALARKPGGPDGTLRSGSASSPAIGPDDIAGRGPDSRSLAVDASDSIASAPEALTVGGMASVYIEREEALAHDADGAAVLFSNISDDAAERRDFWRLVENYERSPSKDKMELLMKGHQVFWTKVAEDPDCPADVRAALTKAEPHLTTEITPRDNQLIRAIMKRYGWNPREKRPAAETDEQRDAREEREVASSFGAKFHDGRGGRVQFRIVGELPFDVDHQARVRILKGFADEFEMRGLPYIAVMHAPDHTNDERNWHFHLVYHDRPAKRFTGRREDHLQKLPDRATKAAKSSHAIAERALESDLTKWHGRWDFEVEVEYEQKDGRKKKARPFVQNKDRDCNHRDFVPKLRRKLASLTNVELEEAGLARRLDPRRHEVMGIDKKPDVHLGTQASRLEGLGIPTDLGLQNERNEWERLLSLAEDQRRAVEEQVDQQLLRWRKQFGEVRIEDKQQKLVDQALDDWKRASLIAAEHAYIARSIKQHYDRMQSRALKVKRVTERHLVAITERRANARQTADRAGYEAKLEQANIYLAGLNVLMAQEIAQIANSEHFAKLYGDNAQRLSDQIGNALERCRTQQADRARVSEPEAADLSIKAPKAESGVREGPRTIESIKSRGGERRQPDAPSERPSQTQIRDAEVINAIRNEYLRPAHKKVGEALVLSFAIADANLFQLDQETIICDPRSIQRIEGAIQANERAMTRLLAYIRAHPHRVEGPDGHQLLALASNAPRELREIASNFSRDPELRRELHDAARRNEDALASYRRTAPDSTSEASKSPVSQGSNEVGKPHIQRAVESNEIASGLSPSHAARNGGPHRAAISVVAKPIAPPVTNAAREPDGIPSTPKPQPATALQTSTQTNRDTVSQNTGESDAAVKFREMVSDWQKAVSEGSLDANRLAWLIRNDPEASNYAERVLMREQLDELERAAAAHSRQQLQKYMAQMQGRGI